MLQHPLRGNIAHIHFGVQFAAEFGFTYIMSNHFHTFYHHALTSIVWVHRKEDSRVEGQVHYSHKTNKVFIVANAPQDTFMFSEVDTEGLKEPPNAIVRLRQLAQLWQETLGSSIRKDSVQLWNIRFCNSIQDTTLCTEFWKLRRRKHPSLCHFTKDEQSETMRKPFIVAKDIPLVVSVSHGGKALTTKADHRALCAPFLSLSIVGLSQIVGFLPVDAMFYCTDTELIVDFLANGYLHTAVDIKFRIDRHTGGHGRFAIHLENGTILPDLYHLTKEGLQDDPVGMLLIHIYQMEIDTSQLLPFFFSDPF